MSYNINAGDKVVLTVIRADINNSIRVDAQTNGIAKTEYLSQVDSVLNETELVIHVPIHRGQLVYLSELMRYSFVFHTAGGRIRYIGKVDSYFKEGTVFLMSVKLLSMGVPIQRREFYRFSCRMSFTFNLISADGFESEDEYSGVVRDVSGGGFCFFSNEEFGADQKIRCMLDIGGNPIIAIGLIGMKVRLKDRSHNFEYRVSFSGIRNSDRERIIKFIFEEQRRQLSLFK